MYEALVARLRCQLYGNCPACVNWYTEEVEPNLWRERCAAIDAADAIEELTGFVQEAERDRDEYRERLDKANDAIEELMAFARFVAEEIVVDDNEWGNNQNAFPEIACRKLFELGIVSRDGEMWHYEPPKEEA